MAADALAPCINMSSAGIVLYIYNGFGTTGVDLLFFIF